jgi:hypothetical protein
VRKVKRLEVIGVRFPPECVRAIDRVVEQSLKSAEPVSRSDVVRACVFSWFSAARRGLPRGEE